LVPGNNTWKTFSVHLYEDDGKLKWEETLKPNEKAKGTKDVVGTYSLDYDKVIFVKYAVPFPNYVPPSLHVSDSLGHDYVVPLPDEKEGEKFAEYVARKSPLGLELIGHAWRVRKSFQCPQDGRLGCRDFKELLDHGDPAIAEYFYSRDETAHTYACFRDKQSFFILQYTHLGESGGFQLEEFQNQQTDNSRSGAGEIKWFPTFGQISESRFGKPSSLGFEIKENADPAPLGTIDDSSLHYETEYQNRENTTTHYSLSVRWSTGRFIENYSWRDKKGETVNFDQTGVCTKLN
jgi:hypothetical protein